MRIEPIAWTKRSKLLVFLLSASCGGAEAPSMGEARIDTLSGGGVHVRNTARGTWEREGVERWRLVEDLRIGRHEGADPYLFGTGLDVIPDPHGRIWVMDRQSRELRLFDADGTFVRAVGRTGRGPGEFTGHACAFPGPGGEIWVEEALHRWQRFDTSGAYLAVHPVTSRFGCATRQWTPDGRFFVLDAVIDYVTRSTTPFFVVHRMDSGGALVQGDTIYPPDLPPAPSVTWISPGGTRIVSGIPFAHRPRWVLDSKGDFWMTDGGGAYAIRRQSPRGDTLLMIEREYAPIAIPDTIRRRAIDEFRREGMTAEGGFSPGAGPRVYPPFDRFYTATDGTLWVRRQLEDAVSGFDVFSADGRYLGPVELPAELDRMAIGVITADEIYGSIRDELDVPRVVRLAIRRPDGIPD